MNIETMLHERIADDFEKLGQMEVGTDEYKSAAATLNQFMDRAIEMEKIAVDKEHKEETRINEHELKLKQMDEDRTDRIVRNALTGANIAVGAGLAIWGTFKTLKFEETGTITTSAGRKFIGKLFSGGK